jgi:hypothetical protein
MVGLYYSASIPAGRASAPYVYPLVINREEFMDTSWLVEARTMDPVNHAAKKKRAHE